MTSALIQRNMKRSSVCPICQKLFQKVTTIQECCHRFCEKCITKKITDEGLHNCPVCNVDLGSAPLQRLRYEKRMHALNSVDYRWHKTLNEFNKNANRASGSSLLKPKQEICEFDAKSHTPEASSRTTNLNMKYEVDSLKSEKNGTIKAEPYSAYQSADLRARQRDEKKTVISTQTVADCKNVKCSTGKVMKEFWFSLVASDNQRCKAPLEQIPSKYLRVKDGNITVLCIKKYLMQKLKLRSENEVSIFMKGCPLLPSMQIRKVVEMWLRTSQPLQKKKAIVGSSASEFVLTLTYSRR